MRLAKYFNHEQKSGLCVHRNGRVAPSSNTNIADAGTCAQETVDARNQRRQVNICCGHLNKQLTLNSFIRMAGRSNSTSPWITTSLAPVCVSLIEQPDENFLPKTFDASLIFRSGTVSRPATTVTNFRFWRCTRVITILVSSTVAFLGAAAPPPAFFFFFFSPSPP